MNKVIPNLIVSKTFYIKDIYLWVDNNYQIQLSLAALLLYSWGGGINFC